MPCVAKKFEVAREQLKEDDLFDSDVCITTRELARMIKEAGIDFKNLDDEDFDPIYGESSGAGVIFGATGGVMEAAARTAVEAITGEVCENVDYEAVRGLDGLKEATITAGDKEIKVEMCIRDSGNVVRCDLLHRCTLYFHLFKAYGRCV